MADRVIAIRITSDGRAFVVDQAANTQAVAKLGALCLKSLTGR